MRRKTFESLVYAGVAGLLFTLFYLAVKSSLNEGETLFGMNYNLSSYALIVAGSLGAFLVFWLVVEKRISKDETLAPRGIRIAAEVVALLAGLFFVFNIYDSENSIEPASGKDFYRNSGMHYQYFLELLAAAAVLAALNYYIGHRFQKIRYVAGCATAAVAGVLAYCPNPQLDISGTIFHIDAYVNSIIHVANGQPYTYYNLSVYGHYGIIFRPFVKLFGGDYQAVAIALAFFTFLTFLAITWVLAVWIRTDVLYYVSCASALGMVTLLYSFGQYYQANPHRLLFGALTLAAITLSVKRQMGMKSTVVLGIIVTGLSFVWNTETGVFCILTYAVYLFMRQIRENLNVKQFFKAVGECILFGVVSVVLAFTVVDFYNFISGRRTLIGIKEFIYPMASGVYSINKLRMILPTAWSVYVLSAILYCLAVVAYVMHYKKARTDDELFSLDVIRVANAVCGLCGLTYFMNRAAYSNISVTWPYFIIAAALAADFLRGSKAGLIRGFRIALLIGLGILGLESVINIPGSFDKRSGTGWYKENYDALLANVNAVVPKDTFAVGVGTAEIYYSLGWDTGIVAIDFPDMNQMNDDYIRDELKKHDSFFASLDDLATQMWPDDVVYDLNDWNLVETFEIGGDSYGYFTRKAN